MKLIDIYMEGWMDENDIYIGKKKPASYKGISKTAYDLGRSHYIMGDELSSIDNLTIEEIIKQIHEIYYGHTRTSD